jgi:hypothetical protein
MPRKGLQRLAHSVARTKSGKPDPAFSRGYAHKKLVKLLAHLRTV